MTLQVPFDQFAETVKRLLKLEEAYVSSHLVGSVATSAMPDRSLVVVAVMSMPPESATEKLKEAGLEVFNGTWLTPEEVLMPDVGLTQTHIAAVSYRSSGDKAGIWVDAYPFQPSQGAVLKAMYDDFRETGELDDVSFEDFTQIANPHVVIVSPSEIERFLRGKEVC